MELFLIASSLILSPAMGSVYNGNHCGGDPLAEDIVIIEPDAEAEDQSPQEAGITLIEAWPPEDEAEED